MSSERSEFSELLAGRVRVPLAAISFAVSRSSGPGGQNVNKQNTRLELRVPVAAIENATPQILQRLEMLAGKRLLAAGELRLVCQQTRSLEQNRAIAMQDLVELLEEACRIPKPRRATKPSRGSKRRRAEAKRRRSETKAQRRSDTD